MTFSQQMVYESIKQYIRNNCESPTIREICELAGLSSPATVHKHLKNLKDKGYIDYRPKTGRSIRILKWIKKIIANYIDY